MLRIIELLLMEMTLSLWRELLPLTSLAALLYTCSGLLINCRPLNALVNFFMSCRAFRTALCKSKRGGFKDTLPDDLLATVLKVSFAFKTRILLCINVGT